MDDCAFSFASQLPKQKGVLVRGTGVVLECEKRTKKNGESYLRILLADASGKVECRVWENATKAEEAFTVGHVLQYEGQTDVYEEALQVSIERLKRVPVVNAALYPPGTTGLADEFVHPRKAWTPESSWIATDRCERIRILTNVKMEEFLDRHSSIPRKAATSPKDELVDPEQLRMKLEALKKKYLK